MERVRGKVLEWGDWGWEWKGYEVRLRVVEKNYNKEKKKADAYEKELATL
jgi:hypothetical protein